MLETIIGAALSVAVLSYLIGDNFLYRLATHVLVGVGAAYAVGVAISQVLYPRLFVRVTSSALGDQVLGWFGVLGCVFLLAKLLRRVAWLGNVSVGYMLGVGAGTAVGGALVGTLAPQTLSSALSLNPAGVGLGGAWINLLILTATVATLVAFFYGRASTRSPIGLVGALGRGFLYIAFGATFALVFIASASVLSALVRDLFIGLSGR
jgi:hypothetical protein